MYSIKKVTNVFSLHGPAKEPLYKLQYRFELVFFNLQISAYDMKFHPKGLWLHCRDHLK
jgi:hypothetical protein